MGYATPPPVYQPKYETPKYEPPKKKPVPQVSKRPLIQPPIQQQFEFGDGDGDGGDGGGDGGDGSPVILDLNGDGKLDVGGKNGPKVKFDLFGDGTDVSTEWLKEGAEDGLLVADFNGDGKIDSGRELMRNTGVNGEQHQYLNGWEKLRALFDKNQDGKISGNELDNLQVWVDSDADGVTDEGELQSVKSRGVTEIFIPETGEMKSSFNMNGQNHYAEDYIFDIEVNRKPQ